MASHFVAIYLHILHLIRRKDFHWLSRRDRDVVAVNYRTLRTHIVIPVSRSSRRLAKASALSENRREHSWTGENNSFAEGCDDLPRTLGAYFEAKGDSTRNVHLRRVDYIVSYVSRFPRMKTIASCRRIIADGATLRAVTEVTTSHDGNDPSLETIRYQWVNAAHSSFEVSREISFTLRESHSLVRNSRLLLRVLNRACRPNAFFPRSSCLLFYIF